MFIDNKKIVISNLQIEQLKQDVDYVLTSDNNGVVTWKSTTAYTNGKSYDHYVGEHFGGGIVVAVFKENGIEKCLVVAPNDIVYEMTTFDSFDFSYSLNDKLPWSNVQNTACGATSSAFGATNSQIIRTQAGFDVGLYVTVNTNTDTQSIGSAVSWCDAYVNPDLGTGVYNDWYLPSIYELMELDNNRMIVNKVLDMIELDQVHPKPNNLIFYDEPGRQNTLTNRVFGSYWSSTEKSATEAFYVEYSEFGSVTSSIKSAGKYQLGPIIPDFSNFFKARPFRIATDGGLTLRFDADYIVISYKFFEGNDVDTMTRMIYPNSTSHPALITPWSQDSAYNPGVNGGPKSANFVGYDSNRNWANTVYGNYGLGYEYDYTPNITDTIPAPAGFYNNPRQLGGNNYDGYYSVLRSSGDNTGLGYEQIIINITAFKIHFPGVNTIEVDCRAYRRGATIPDNGIPDEVLLGVRMYKGGQMQRKSYDYIVSGATNPDFFEWENPTSTKSADLDSIPVLVGFSSTTTQPTVTGYSARRTKRLGILRYEIDKQIATILTDYNSSYAVETY